MKVWCTRVVCFGVVIFLFSTIPFLISINIDRACRLSEWPYFEICTDRLAENTAAKIARYRVGIANNPGDISNYILLGMGLSVPEKATREARGASGKEPPISDRNARRAGSGSLVDQTKGAKVTTALASSRESVARLGESKALISIEEANATKAALQLAPQDLQLLQLRAKRALDAKDWATGVPILVGIVEHYNDPVTALHLLRMLSRNEGVEVMIASLKPKSLWLGRVILQVGPANMPVDVVMPLVLPALERRAIVPSALQQVISLLKYQGQTLTAHALWLRTQPEPVPIVVNGDFDTSFRKDGFGWEIPALPASRSGVGVRLTRVRDRSGVLELDFNGRPLHASPLKQTLILPGGRYELTGQYMTEKLAAENGMVWVLKCGSDATVLGRTEPLMDTVRLWQTFSMVVEVPSACGNVVELSLETGAPYEMEAGFKGALYFDAIAIQSASRVNDKTL